MPVRVNDEEWSEIRAESKRLQKEYSACQWNRENKENNRSEAARLSKKAISLKNRMNEAKKFAAEKIFKITNENCCEGEIDLHGLLVDETSLERAYCSRQEKWLIGADGDCGKRTS